ncbi:DUF6049 family protein [Actinotalea sp. Marseille-Q4924]|uniref:DUF6049 family protein n=1 Tax=Actinotalea sp. Marseille-Q4924 TaxID=2866571 RepID=UPI001CE3C1EA|nr:DUF6049 family protein [Actinotalea sp. Marseille-Q4924]
MSRSSRWRAAAAAVGACVLTGLTAATGAAATGGIAPIAPVVADGVPAVSPATASVPATNHADDAALPVTVEITAVTPQVLRPGQDLTVTARLTNTSQGEVAQPRVFLHVDGRSYISRTSLDGWRTAPLDGALGGIVAQGDTGAPLPPGAATTVTVTVPADGLGLARGERAWGPRGLAVQVVDAADPARVRLGAARSFALWFPVEEVTATRMSVLVPLVGPAFDPYDSQWVADLGALTTDGRLARVLEATEEQSDVTWVLDPWLAEAAAVRAEEPAAGDPAPEGPDAGTPEGDPDDDAPTDSATDSAADSAADGTDPTPSPSPTQGAGRSMGAMPGAVGDDDGAASGAGGVTAPEAVTTWATRLLDGVTDRDVHLLPYLDADVEALAHAGAEDVLALARERGAEVADDVGLPASGAGLLSWPATDLPDLTTASFVQADGARAVVVGPGELAPPAVLTYTPSGRTTVDTARGEITALVADERLSDALRTGSLTLDDDGDARDDEAQRTPATAAQDLLAELAVITRERPTDGRHVLATLPREWSPDVAVVQAQLGALADAPWVRMEPVTALVGAPDTDVDRGTLPRRVVGEREVSADLLDAVAEAVADRAALATMVDQPDRLAGDGALEVLAPTSVAWRERPRDRADLADKARALTAALEEAVAVVPGSDLTIIASSAGIPVRVTNALDQDVSVVVDLRPDSARLRSDGGVPVTVPANGEEVVQVPVHAIQSADVAVAVEVRTPAGVLVDDDTVIAVRVRADWEGIGTAGIGALLALGLVVGLVRSIRRGRTGRRAQPQPYTGPDALSPEQVAELEGATGRSAGGDGPSTTETVHDRAGAGAVDHTGGDAAAVRGAPHGDAPDGRGPG